MNSIEIPLSQRKILLSIAGSFLFVAIGIFFITTMADQQTRFNPTLVKAIGVVAIVFFSATGIFGIKKLSDKSIGLTIDDNGITDNTSAISIGLIKWSDITAIETKEVMSTKFLLIYTTNPNHFIEKVQGFKRKLMATNMSMYGTPIAITSTTLQYNFNDLEKLLMERWEIAQASNMSNGNS
jgi:surface polysaccharide O-acyltransferase-like enzyme